ncbi:transposable element Tcb2 transposase [Trichonephila clavipes]|nr:transposable element Tcb2 transposase [Trichonephila clavipes]
MQISGTKRRKRRERTQNAGCRRALLNSRIKRRTETQFNIFIASPKFGINKSVVSRAWKTFQTIGSAVRKVGGGRPRTTTAGDDLYIILQAKRGRRQSASDIAQQLSTVTNKELS